MRLAWIIVIASLALWSWRVVDFALIGSYAPSAFLVVILAIFGWGWRSGDKGLRRSIRFWGGVLAAFGLARFVLTVILILTPSISMHGFEAQTLFYHAGTAFYLFGGLWLAFKLPARTVAA